MTGDKQITRTEKKKRLKATVLAFFLLYFSNETLLFGTNEDRVFFVLHIAVLVCVFFALLLEEIFLFGRRRVRISIPYNMGHLWIALSAMTVLTMVANMDMSIKYGYQIFMLAFSALVVVRTRLADFLEGYNRVMLFLSVASLVALLFSVLTPSLIDRLPTVTNSVGTVFRFYGLGFLEASQGALITRNYGIFREPGVYSVFLLLAVLFELFAIETVRTTRVIVYVAALFFTFSTMSFLVIPLVAAVYFLKISTGGAPVKHPSLLKLLAGLMLLLFAFSLIGNFDRVFDRVFNKLFTENSSRDSRLASVFANIDMMLRRPLWGNGFTFVEDNFAAYSGRYVSFGGHNTNTLLRIMSIYGLPCVLTLGYCLYCFFKKYNRSFISLSLLAVFAIVLSNEDLIVNITPYVLAFYGLKPREEREPRGLPLGGKERVG